MRLLNDDSSRKDMDMEYEIRGRLDCMAWSENLSARCTGRNGTSGRPWSRSTCNYDGLLDMGVFHGMLYRQPGSWAIHSSLFIIGNRGVEASQVTIWSDQGFRTRAASRISTFEMERRVRYK